jgi:hypothetical protein
MRSRRSLAGRAGCVVALLATTVAVPLTASAPAAPGGCRVRSDAQVRFDDGRLLVERSERSVDPRNVRERWWACWRPTGRTSLLEDRRHQEGRDETSLLGVRRGRFAVLARPERLDVHDGRRGRLTATIDHRGVVRELVVTRAGRVAAIQDEGRTRRILIGGAGTRSCLLDAATPVQADGPLADLSVRKESIAWFNHGVPQGDNLAALDC